MTGSLDQHLFSTGGPTLSGYRMNADMGLMAETTISLAQALDFLLLPTLLVKVERGGKETAGWRKGPDGFSAT